MSLALDPAAQDLLFREAQTANTFTDEPVTEEQVQAIYDLVKYGPTAFNQTPLRITLVRSAEARERLVQHMARGQPARRPPPRRWSRSSPRTKSSTRSCRSSSRTPRRHQGRLLLRAPRPARRPPP